jgi:membrane-associated protease RseP (regulator of RpoE activity)
LNFRVSGGPGGFSYVLGDDAKRWQELGARLGRVYAEPSIVVAKPAKVMLGVNMTEPGPALERQLKLEPGATTMLSGVYDGLPAHEAGLAEYDIITAVNDQKPADPASIRKVLAAAEPDETIKLAVLSGGVSRNVDVKLVKHDGEAMRKARLLGAGAEAEELDPLQRTFSRWRGFQFQDANELPGQDVIVTPDAQMFRVPRVAPVPPIPPVAAGDANMQKQLDQVNERLRRLEQLLEKLTIEKQQPR